MKFSMHSTQIHINIEKITVEKSQSKAKTLAKWKARQKCKLSNGVPSKPRWIMFISLLNTYSYLQTWIFLGNIVINLQDPYPIGV